MFGFLTATAIENVLKAGERSENKRSAGDARSISYALEDFREKTGAYPPMDRGIAGLPQYLEPTYMRNLPTTDMYGRPFIVFRDASGAAVVSTGRNGFVVRRQSLTPPDALSR